MYWITPRLRTSWPTIFDKVGAEYLTICQFPEINESSRLLTSWLHIQCNLLAWKQRNCDADGNPNVLLFSSHNFFT